MMWWKQWQRWLQPMGHEKNPAGAVLAASPDPVWDNEFYGSGKFPRAPYDTVASFVYRHAPKRSRNTVRILEIGCGAGNNVWFLASEGFAVAGTDGSPAAIEYAQQRLRESGFEADVRVAAFPLLPFEDESFDLCVERAALVYVPAEI